MSDSVLFNSSLSIEEIEDHFKDFDFFAGLEESLNEALTYEKEKLPVE